MGPVRGKIASEIRDYYKRIFDKKGYDFYEDGDYNLNIIGVRSWNDFTNEFDDDIDIVRCRFRCLIPNRKSIAEARNWP